MDDAYREWRSLLIQDMRRITQGLPLELAQLIIAAILTHRERELSALWDALAPAFGEKTTSSEAIKREAAQTAELFRRVLADHDGRKVYEDTLGLAPTTNGTVQIIARSFTSPVFVTHVILNGTTLHKPAFFYNLVTACNWAWDDAKNVHHTMEGKAAYAAGVEKVFTAINNLIDTMQEYLPYMGEQTPMLIRYADWHERKMEAEIFRTDLVDMESGLRGPIGGTAAGIYPEPCEFAEPPPCPSATDATESGEPSLNQLLGMVRSTILNTFEDLGYPSFGNAAEEVIGQSRKQKGEIVQLYLRTIFEKLRQMSFPTEGRHIENHILPIARIISGMKMEPHHIRQAWKKWKEYRPSGEFTM